MHPFRLAARSDIDSGHGEFTVDQWTRPNGHAANQMVGFFIENATSLNAQRVCGRIESNEMKLLTNHRGECVKYRRSEIIEQAGLV